MAARIDSRAVEFRRGYMPDTSSEQYSYRGLLCSPRLDCSWSGMSWKALEVFSFLLQWSALPKKKSGKFPLLSYDLVIARKLCVSEYGRRIGGLIPVRYFPFGSMVKEFIFLFCNLLKTIIFFVLFDENIGVWKHTQCENPLLLPAAHKQKRGKLQNRCVCVHVSTN
jgi:hypothetical protein